MGFLLYRARVAVSVAIFSKMSAARRMMFCKPKTERPGSIENRSKACKQVSNLCVIK